MSIAADTAPIVRSHRVLAQLDAALGWITEIPAAILVLAEVIVLLLGVISRFVFNRPLVWSDEIASLLFLWLAMLGAAIALRRGVHMRLTTVTARMAPVWRARLDAFAVGVPLLFLLLLISPTLDYVDDQSYIETPALGWSGSIRAYAMVAGIVLMLAVSLLRLARQGLLETLLMTVVLAALAGLLYLWSPHLVAMGNWNLLVFFVILVGAGVLLGIPIAFAFGLSTAAYLMTVTSTTLSVITGRLDEGMSSLILLAVPLFVLLGQLVEMTGMARAMVGFLAALVGHVRGGLSYVLLGGMLLVSGISGSKAADMAAVAPVLFPEMKRRGLNEGEMVSLLAASGAMAETIPPSLVLIAIASVTGVSIAALFTGGLLPGVVLAIALAIVARQRTKSDEREKVARASLKTIGWTFIVGLPALVLPMLIRAAVVEGVATATEVSTIGIVYAIVAGLLVYRQFDFRRIYPMLVETACLSGAILFIIGAATGMAWALTQSGFSQALAHAMGSVPGGAFGFLVISIFAFVILGSVLEGIPAMVLFGPLLFPIARQIGVNEVHYAVVIILAMGIGLFAPPFGLGYYTACTIGRVHPDLALKRIWPYLGVLMLALLLIAAVPWFSTGVPVTGPLPGALTGKVALVTGAGSGLGRHFAITLAAAGACVIAAGRRAEALATVAGGIAASGGVCHVVTMDVTDAASVTAGLTQATHLAGAPPDILVNNAGIAMTKAAIDLTPADWQGVMDTNLTGAFFMAQAVARVAREAGRGASIVNVASILGVRVAGLVAPYAASKAALIQLTKALALEWARYGIRVNALAPGYIETDLNAEFFASEPGRKLIQRIPQRRLGALHDLDGPLLLLASDASAYMTGAVIEVDGGHLVSSL